MQISVSPVQAQTAAKILTAILQNPKTILSQSERSDLTDFLSDLQDALDNEAERQYLSRQTGAF